MTAGSNVTAALLVASLALAALSGCAANKTGTGDQYAASTGAAERGPAPRRLFRTETAPADAPFTRADLLRDFALVAFEPEAQLAPYYPAGQARLLSRWSRAPRYAVLGDAATASDRARIAETAALLSQATGMAIEPSPEGVQPDIAIFLHSPEARRTLGERHEGAAWYEASILRRWVESPDPPCIALMETETPVGGAIRRAAIFIQGELADPLRQTCLVEELSQSMGPIFDHPEVRPSIFNDDQEFIALTEHDMALLSLLYAPGMHAGMTRDEAIAIARARLENTSD